MVMTFNKNNRHQSIKEILRMLRLQMILQENNKNLSLQKTFNYQVIK
jgi:hypothetical protein